MLTSSPATVNTGLYSEDLVTFEEGAIDYDHNDAAGFIELQGLRLRTIGYRNRKAKG